MGAAGQTVPGHIPVRGVTAVHSWGGGMFFFFRLPLPGLTYRHIKARLTRNSGMTDLHCKAGCQSQYGVCWWCLMQGTALDGAKRIWMTSNDDELMTYGSWHFDSIYTLCNRNLFRTTGRLGWMYFTLVIVCRPCIVLPDRWTVLRFIWLLVTYRPRPSEPRPKAAKQHDTLQSPNPLPNR